MIPMNNFSYFKYEKLFIAIFVLFNLKQVNIMNSGSGFNIDNNNALKYPYEALKREISK